MIVCHCRAVSHREVVAAAESGAREVSDVAAVCGAGSECFGCHDRIMSLLEAIEDRLVLQAAS
jgi:bacterioferritin-associated ferredoxin